MTIKYNSYSAGHAYYSLICSKQEIDLRESIFVNVLIINSFNDKHFRALLLICMDLEDTSRRTFAQ